MIDTPGIRSFGLAHIEPDDVMLAFSDLAEAIKDCPRGCGHMGPPADPECALDSLTGPAAGRVAAARRLLGALSESSDCHDAVADRNWHVPLARWAVRGGPQLAPVVISGGSRAPSAGAWSGPW